MDVSPKGPLSHCQRQVCKHLGAQAVKLPNGVGGQDMLVEGNMSPMGHMLLLWGVWSQEYLECECMHG
jgi:hypothetical protein